MNKIVPWEKADFSQKHMDETIVVDDVTVMYSQQPDCTQDVEEDDWQELTISTRNNGVARFFCLSTKEWSINDIEDLQIILEDFKKRAGIEDEKETNKQEEE